VKNLRQRIVREVLPQVSSPAQYVGGELNSVVKRREDVEVTVCLAFPDTYAIGMSQTGLHILYGTLNARPDVAAERAFAPWPDMADLLAEKALPLCSLETFTPLSEFDIVGFSLQYEMGYTNVLAMLELANIPEESARRSPQDPLVIAGGPGAFNPEPLADFIDVFVPGDGEWVVHELVDAYGEARKGAASRMDLCRTLARAVQGIYVPALYESGYPRRPRFDDVPAAVQASVVDDLDQAYFPEAPIVPYVETVHDRITLEIMRGCAHGCRYCQAGMTRRPVRCRSVDRLETIAANTYAATGHSEISLASLSSSDYPGLKTLVERLSGRLGGRSVSLSVPSLRVNDRLRNLPGMIGTVRKSGLTIAPEAATERLRRVINKDVSDEDLFQGVQAAYEEGWRRVKLYFMCGLPTETDEDVRAIARLATDVSNLHRRKGRGPAFVNLNVSTFVPKPHTPFQWEPMVTIDRMRDIRGLIASELRSRSVKLRFHNPERSFLEGVFSRGDAALGEALREARKLGCRFDAWDEHFNYEAWTAAFEACGIDAASYACRPRDPSEALPWQHVDVGISEAYLRSELDRARRRLTTPHCLDGECRRCGLPRCPHRDRSAR